MNILFVCEGNICKSPIAVAIYQKFYGEGFSFRSSGLRRNSVTLANPHTIIDGCEIGIALSKPQSSQVSGEFLQKSGLIVAMKNHQLNLNELSFPWIASRDAQFGEPVRTDFPKFLSLPVRSFSNFVRSTLEMCNLWMKLLRR